MFDLWKRPNFDDGGGGSNDVLLLEVSTLNFKLGVAR